MNVLITTWRGGGASQPAIGLGRLLALRGHQVRILAPAGFAERVAAARCSIRPFPSDLEFNPELGRAFEDQPTVPQNLFFGPVLPRAVAAEIGAEPTDLVVVDYLLRSVVCLAEARPLPHAMLMHMAYHHHAAPVTDSTDEWSQRWQYEQVNAVRAEQGLRRLPVGPESVSVALARRAAAALVVMTREFDAWPDPPASVVHVGPIAEDVADVGWEAPWAEDDRRPLIVISMSTMYMHHEDILGRVAGAVADMDARVLVLTGSELAPEDVACPPGVYIRSYVPHATVLPAAALVVTHGGMGTLMAAFSAGVPALCIPLGRDQTTNARQAQKLGASAVLAPDSGAAAIRQGVESALASRQLQAGARKMAASVRRYQAGVRAVQVLERLGRSAPTAGLDGK